MNARKYPYNPDYAVAPGETVRETMEYLGLTQREFAMRLDTSVQTLNRIFRGTQPITVEMANKLERVTGTPASFWNNFESRYRSQLAKIKEAEASQKQKDWLMNFPIKELKKRGYLATSRPDQISDGLLRFFGVSTWSAWKTVWGSPAVAARRSRCFDSNLFLAATWIRMGEIEARKKVVGPTDRKRFKKTLQLIRPLTCERPDVFCPSLEKLCADCGVILVFVPELKKLSWYGATKWHGNTAIIMLNLRGKREDTFWFSFFHEAGHVILHGKSELFINDGTIEDERERQANEFALSVLFGKERDRIPELANVEEICTLARELNICPGIVAGQYQYQTKQYRCYNQLIRHFHWVGEDNGE